MQKNEPGIYWPLCAGIGRRIHRVEIDRSASEGNARAVPDVRLNNVLTSK